MTIHVERVSGALKCIKLTCDECQTTLDDKQIIAGGGLKKLGWRFSDKKHICEKCEKRYHYDNAVREKDG